MFICLTCIFYVLDCANYRCSSHPFWHFRKKHQINNIIHEITGIQNTENALTQVRTYLDRFWRLVDSSHEFILACLAPPIQQIMRFVIQLTNCRSPYSSLPKIIFLDQYSFQKISSFSYHSQHSTSSPKNNVFY